VGKQHQIDVSCASRPIEIVFMSFRRRAVLSRKRGALPIWWEVRLPIWEVWLPKPVLLDFPRRQSGRIRPISNLMFAGIFVNRGEPTHRFTTPGEIAEMRRKTRRNRQQSHEPAVTCEKSKSRGKNRGSITRHRRSPRQWSSWATQMRDARSTRLFKWAKWFCLSTLALVLIAAVALIFERFRGARALKREIGRLSAAGERLDLADHIPKPAASNQNAAILLRSITNELRSINALDEFVPLLRFASPGKAVVAWRLNEWPGNKSTNRWETLGPRITAHSNLLTTAHLLSQFPVFDSGFNYRKGFVDFENGPLVEVKRTADLLSAATVYELHRNDIDAAHRHLLPLVNLSQQKTEPMIIWQLIRQTCLNRAVHATWQFLQHPAITEQHLQSLQAAFGRADFSADMSASIEMERAMSLDFYRQVKTSRETLDRVISQREEWGPPFNTFVTSGFLLRDVNVPLWRFSWADQDELRALNRWQAIIAVDRQARSNGWASTEHVRQGDSSSSAAIDLSGILGEPSENGFDRFRYLFSTEAFSVSDTLIFKTLAVQTLQHMVAAALALKRFELRNNKLPETLNALVPDFLAALPRDEMVHQPLRYRRISVNSFLLYSVGRNGIDDGGDATPPTNTPYSQIWEGRDAVWPSPATDDAAERAMKLGK
jgi:hypothetical protein